MKKITFTLLTLTTLFFNSCSNDDEAETTQPENNAPIATDGSVSLEEGNSITFDIDPTDEEDAQEDLTITITELPEIGNLTYVDEAVLTNDTFSLVQFETIEFEVSDIEEATTTTLEYTVTDTEGATDTGIITINITIVVPENNAPIATDYSITVDENDTTTFDIDPTDLEDAQEDLTITITKLPEVGDLVYGDEAVLVNDTFTLAEFETISFGVTNIENDVTTTLEYIVTDSQEATASGIITVEIIALDPIVGTWVLYSINQEVVDDCSSQSYFIFEKDGTSMNEIFNTTTTECVSTGIIDSEWSNTENDIYELITNENSLGLISVEVNMLDNGQTIYVPIVYLGDDNLPTADIHIYKK